MTKFIHSKEEQKVKLQSTLLKMRGNEPNFHKKVKQYRNVKRSIHQKKRKLYSLTLKLEKLESDFMGENRRFLVQRTCSKNSFILNKTALLLNGGKKNGRKKERPNSPLSAQKTKHSGINHARMI